MSAVLRKRFSKRDELLQTQILTLIIPVATLILTLAALLGLFGHFFPAR